MRTAALLVAFTGAATTVFAHGGGSAPHRDEGEHLDWVSRHMFVEHHMQVFTPSAFFELHDFDGSKTWTAHEILRTYGINPTTNVLVDETGGEGKVLTQEQREHLLNKVLELCDFDHDGAISLDEFEHFWNEGGRLPDFGFGTGHHGDDEYEYEIHHYEKYHGDGNDDEEHLNHAEDIAHFKKHEELEEQERMWEQETHQTIIERNIPARFKTQRPNYDD